MNKALVVWNIVITIALAAAVLSGCSSMDPQFTALQTQVNQNRSLVEQVVSRANQNGESISSMQADVMKNTLTIANLQTTTQAALAAQKTSLEQYIQQYVQAYVAEASQ
jgi:hypothetical protein